MWYNIILSYLITSLFTYVLSATYSLVALTRNTWKLEPITKYTRHKTSLFNIYISN